MPRQIPVKELRFTYARSGGPGGQKVNKTSTKVMLKWSVIESTEISEWLRSRLLKKLASKINQDGDLIIQSDRYRDRGRNTADCLKKLADCIQLASQRTKPRLATKPTKTSREKRLKTKKERSEVKRSRKRVDY